MSSNMQPEIQEKDAATPVAARDGSSTASTSGKLREPVPRSLEKAELMSLSTGKELHNLFDNIDRNHTGKIETDELKDALQRLGLPYQSSEYVKELKKQFKADEAGSIDFEEFERYAKRKEEVVKQAFARLDFDHSGTISVDDLEHGLRENWLPLDHDDAGRMIHLLDQDCNGLVSYQEFRTFVFLLPESQISEQAILQSWVDSADWVEGIEYHVAAVPPKQGFNRLVAGGIAGGLSRTAAAPFDRLRIMMMADSNNHSLRRTALKMWKDGGLTGMFRGNFATVLKVIPQTATQFAVYDTLQARMIEKLEETEDIKTSSDLTKVQHLVAGGVAGVAATLVTYPIETIRTHMCMGGKANITKVTGELWHSFGLRGCFRGTHAALGNAILTNALGFTTYEMAVLEYKRLHQGHTPSPAAKGFCAGVAACGVMAVVMPLENVQRRLQVQGRDGFPVLYSGSWDCARRIYRAEGLRAFWRGSLTSFLKVAPSLAAVRFAYELAMHSTMVGGTHRYREELDIHHEPPDPPF